MTNVGILRTVLVLAVSIIASTSAWGDPPATKLQSAQTRPAAAPATKPATTMAARIGSLVKDLGSKDFKTRDLADAAIRKIGLAVVPILRKHLDNPDAEVASRLADIVRYLERCIFITLRTNKAAYEVDEPINLTVWFKNESTSKFPISSVVLRSLSGLAVTDGKGKQVQWEQSTVNSTWSINTGVNPGGKMSLTVAAINFAINPRTRKGLRRFFPVMNRPGTYRLRLHWGEYVSNEVTIKVLAAK